MKELLSFLPQIPARGQRIFEDSGLIYFSNKGIPSRGDDLLYLWRIVFAAYSYVCALRWCKICFIFALIILDRVN